ncbi:hypothetical protein [Aquirufa sp.]|uniref:hypothetical protein n=1 Tax=Aquirufa sp. TaxID=2676249 RepID=UPI0037C14037
MKNLTFIACMIAGVMMSCSKQESQLPEGAVGYIVAKSENIDLSIKSMTALTNLDSATYRSTYSEDAVFYDNLDSMGLNQNIAVIGAMKAKDVTMKLDKILDIHEEVLVKPSYYGVSHFVYAYAVFTLTRGDVQKKVVIHTVDGIKDGKQVVEWLRYDTKDINEIMK